MKNHPVTSLAIQQNQQFNVPNMSDIIRNKLKVQE